MARITIMFVIWCDHGIILANLRELGICKVIEVVLSDLDIIFGYAFEYALYHL